MSIGTASSSTGMIATVAAEVWMRPCDSVSGTHRVQRVPATESQGRIHTSAATVAIIAIEPGGDTDIVINPADLRIDTFRSSGAGGQHVNKTESAIRITHVPSGVVVENQTERSQRIRTYSYPQGRITDHRVEGLTLYDLPNILEGDLDPLVLRLQQEQQAEALARLAQEP